jgi:hypothetical protein
MGYLKIWVHVVWTTKKRQPFLSREIRMARRLLCSICERVIFKPGKRLYKSPRRRAARYYRKSLLSAASSGVLTQPPHPLHPLSFRRGGRGERLINSMFLVWAKAHTIFEPHYPWPEVQGNSLFSTTNDG